MRRRITFMLTTGLLLAVLVVVVVPQVAMAQGSTGGTLGKTDQSLSGSLDKTAPKASERTTSPQKKERPTGDDGASACRKLPGTWSWFVGGDVTIRPNGRAATDSLTGSWTCNNGQVVIVWSHGFTDRLSLSRDGNHLNGTNGFTAVTGQRK